MGAFGRQRLWRVPCGAGALFWTRRSMEYCRKLNKFCMFNKRNVNEACEREIYQKIKEKKDDECKIIL